MSILVTDKRPDEAGRGRVATSWTSRGAAAYGLREILLD
jgi:hypothetical protein